MDSTVLLSRSSEFAELVEKQAGKYEFKKFLLGLVLPRELRKQLNLEEQEALSKGLKIAIGRKLEQDWAAEGKIVEFKMPEVVFLIDIDPGKVHVQLNSLYVYGRYLKYSREIPQSKWPCKRCKGKDCPKCGGTGKIYPTSVEELIAEPFLKHSKSNRTRFHCVGREDIDARMLGSGRPFVLEIISPKKRFFDYGKTEREINSKNDGVIGVRGLREVNKKAVEAVKSASPPKTYVALVECSELVSEEELAKLSELEGRVLEQDTPTRVLHRRADKQRKRRILGISAKPIDRTHFELKVKAEAGTYIKEFISGDEGRTRPSVSAALGKRCACKQLDVTEVDFELLG